MLASVASNSAVAAMFEISDATVRRYDKLVLAEDLPPPCLDGRRRLLIDEKNFGKARGFVTVILDGEPVLVGQLQRDACPEHLFGNVAG